MEITYPATIKPEAIGGFCVQFVDLLVWTRLIPLQMIEQEYT